MASEFLKFNRVLGAELIDVEKRTGADTLDDSVSEEYVLHFSNGGEISIYRMDGQLIVEED